MHECKLAAGGGGWYVRGCKFGQVGQVVGGWWVAGLGRCRPDCLAVLPVGWSRSE